MLLKSIEKSHLNGWLLRYHKIYLNKAPEKLEINLIDFWHTNNNQVKYRREHSIYNHGKLQIM